MACNQYCPSLMYQLSFTHLKNTNMLEKRDISKRKKLLVVTTRLHGNSSTNVLSVQMFVYLLRICGTSKIIKHKIKRI